MNAHGFWCSTPTRGLRGPSALPAMYQPLLSWDKSSHSWGANRTGRTRYALRCRSCLPKHRRSETSSCLGHPLAPGPPQTDRTRPEQRPHPLRSIRPSTSDVPLPGPWSSHRSWRMVLQSRAVFLGAGKLLLRLLFDQR